MRTPIPDYLTEVLEACTEDDGHLADYIPELAQADPNKLALAVCMTDGTEYTAGDHDTSFTIQSISKPFAYALALNDLGMDAVLGTVGVEPSGEAFNEISLDPVTNQPKNPMINAGAITVHSMLDDDRVASGFAAFAGRDLEVDTQVYESELGSADRNHAIAYMLRNHGIIDADPAAVVDGYTRQCSYLVTVGDLALMAATLANGGVHPATGDRVVSREVARLVLSVMTTCGMYDAAGDWFTTVGIPAKSGVSGGLIGALPGVSGLAGFSPRLDSHGNTVRGVRMFERLSLDMGMHVMELPPPARALSRGHATVTLDTDAGTEDASLYELHGAVDFVGMERLLRDLTEHTPESREVVLDLTYVHEIRDVGRRMLLEAARRLSLEDHHVTFVDPGGTLSSWTSQGTLDVGDGTLADVVESKDGAR